MTGPAQTGGDAAREAFHRLPKVELHVHLEGAVPPSALWPLIEKHGGDPGLRSPRDLETRFRFLDFEHFIRTWIWLNGFLREPSDYAYIADAAARSLADQGILYAEVTYAPGDAESRGLDTAAVTRAVREGLDRHKDRIRVNLIADLIRDAGPEKSGKWLEQLEAVRVGCQVVGIGIGGSEHRFPPGPYAGVFERAREMGFRTSAHAGEAAGAESVWGAVRDLKVDRIGHGTRAVSDTALLEHLRIHRIPLEVCPVSNLRTGAVKDLREHPVRHFLDRGLVVTINTDDPAMFGTSLEGEFTALGDHIGLTAEEVRRCGRHAIESAWCDEATKSWLLESWTDLGGPSLEKENPFQIG